MIQYLKKKDNAISPPTQFYNLVAPENKNLKKIYYPFAGDGADILDSYILDNSEMLYINEPNADLSLIYRCGANITKELMINIMEKEKKTYNISTNKEAYAHFRDTVYASEYTPTTKLIYFFMLMHSSKTRYPIWDDKNNLINEWGNNNYTEEVGAFISFINILYFNRFISYSTPIINFLSIVEDSIDNAIIINTLNGYVNIDEKNIKYIISWLNANENINFLYMGEENAHTDVIKNKQKTSCMPLYEIYRTPELRNSNKSLFLRAI